MSKPSTRRPSTPEFKETGKRAVELDRQIDRMKDQRKEDRWAERYRKYGGKR